MRLHAIFSQVKAVIAVAAVTYKEWAAYRSHMLLSIVVGPAFLLAQVFIWNAVYAERDSLLGFTLQDMLIYYGAGSVIYYLIMDFADWNLQMLIRSGKFLTYMLRPIPHPLFAFSQKIGHRSLGFIFELIPVYFIFLFVFNIRLIPSNLFLTIVSVSFSFVILFLINYSTGIIAFWLTRTDGIRALIRLLRDLLAGVFLPLSFFPELVQKIMFFLPFQYVTYVPTRVFLGSYELGGWNIALPHIIGIQAVMLIVMIFVTAMLWRMGTRRFTGVGV
jgi:ABC-2 type transport system permease protein